MPVPLFRLWASRMEQKAVWRGGRRIHSGRQHVALFIFCACISFFDIIYYF
ncbi:UNVERIFIED_ORG: hypothetical protein BDK47_11226 [Anoxybacillus amylolyticus]|nr:hypothetical protein GYMC52_1091 [Geobacillus sp. Y412MC52]